MPANSVTPATSVTKGGRNHQFDLMRIVFASLVLLSHAPEVTDDNASREIFNRLTHSEMTFGSVGVDGFFLLSGFLIIRSWQHGPRLFDFLQKRVLRIVPGYMVAVVLSTLVVGWLAPGIPDFFRHLDRDYFESVISLSQPRTPPVLPGSYYPAVNGPMWTIPYEFRCYLVVAFFGFCGLLRRPAIWLVVTVLLLVLASSYTLQAPFERSFFTMVAGYGYPKYRLTAAFFLGGCFYLFRQRIPFRPVGVLISLAAMAVSLAVRPMHFEPVFIVCAGYLLFYCAHTPSKWLDWMHRVPDISYGIYLYGWPVEALWIWYHPKGSPWLAFLVSIIICCILGWTSWHLVERPMLQLKRKATAPLPPP